MQLPHATVLIDATAVPANRAGVGRYVDELLAAFDHEVFIACRAEDAAHYKNLAPRALVLPQPGIGRTWRRLLWEQLTLPGVARRAGAQVIHSPHYTLPLFTHRRRVVTFHDATFFSDPAVHTRIKRAFFRSWIRLSGRLADAIIVPSKATGTELARYTSRAADSYVVVYHGVDRSVFHPPTSSEVVATAVELGLGNAPWIAFLGTIEPRKNIPELLAAYSSLAAQWDVEWGELPTLVLAGGDGWGADIMPDVDRVEAPGRVLRVGYIDAALVHAYLGGALFVVYPSLGEGFGLPVLEAMSSGVPVLTTPRLALPEVGGGAVAYSEPDARSLTMAMRDLAANAGERTRLVALGMERASLFTWQASASSHADVYDHVALRTPQR
jgi:glycosyltransferase involved in cell wall biosynthesis